MRKIGNQVTKLRQFKFKGGEFQVDNVPGKGIIVPNMSTEKNTYLFGSKAREKILALLFLNRSSEFYLREISGKLEISPGNVQREMRNLEKLKIIKRDKRGNRTYYVLNKANPIYKELSWIIKKGGAVVSSLKECLRKQGKKIDAAFIYGSYAKGNDEPLSDIDMFVVGKIKSMDLAAIFRKYEKKYGKEINPYVIGEKELRQKYREGNNFIRSVLKSPKIFVAGDENEIQRIVGRK